SGLWHGANWTFVAWGALNGIYLIAEAMWFKRDRYRLLNVFATFVLINFAWIFFRAASISDALHIVNSIFTDPGKLYIGDGADVTAPIYALMAISFLVLVEIKKEYFKTMFS